MTTIGNSTATLLDLAKRQDPNGKIAKVVELLAQKNQILDDMQWKESNMTLSERVTVRTGLPTVAWRLLNAGVAKSKSTTAQIDEGTGMLEARSEVDKDLADMSSDVAGFRLSEAAAFLEAMNQEMASTLFYGNSGADPEEFTGLSIRYSDLNANNGQNIIDAGGAGADNSSIWLIVWGENSCYGIYPKGTQAGLIHEDLGVGDAFDGSNNRFRAYMDRWQWKCGIALKDWRYAVRIGSIDISAVRDKSTAADLPELMIRAMGRIPDLNAGRAAFYMNRSLWTGLRIQVRDDVQSGGGLTFENQAGKQLLSFDGIPIRMVDALTESEALV